MGKRNLLRLGEIVTLLSIFFIHNITVLSVSTNNAMWSSDFRPQGGFVDEILIKVYSNFSQAIEALQRGEIDAYDYDVFPEYELDLRHNPNISVTYTPSSMFRTFILNCERFPTNITAFRRAMAFGMDKYKATEEIMGDLGAPLDSYIPPALTEWEVESTLETRFYDADYISGNASLEAAGFKDLDGDGWREYDANSNGEWDAGVDLDDNDPLLVINITASAGFDIAIIASEVLRDGLIKMGIRSTVEEVAWWDPLTEDSPLWSKIYAGDYWVVCYQLSFNPTVLPPKALYTDYHSEGEWNPVLHRFYNTTIDSVLNKMLAATTFTDIKKYSREATQLLAYEQPEIPIYSPLNINAYRNDKFEGFLEFAGKGTVSMANPYTLTKVHLKESKGGIYGGIFTYSAMTDISTRNPFRFHDRIGVRAFIENSIYGGLWQPDPTTWDPIPNLAWDWEIEPTTAQAAAGIQAGQKFTFYLYKNASWHDGQPVTSKDVKFSFELPQNYFYPDVFYVPVDINDIYRIDTPDNYTVEFYVNRTDIFAWIDITSYTRILPWHIWKDVENLTAFEPTDAQVIGFGPYKWNERVPGQYVSLLRHENWHFSVCDEAGPSTTSSQESPASKDAYGFEILFAVVGIALIYINRRRKWT
ncbi:MAG: hypothetical protein JSW11_00725 [Candidatus Heimdallarchaeota archaeon]|nr:MAG: hypothetical protein JSW11_00725 [Candidatus Heimdallarchaeota archaeon]